MKKSGKSQTKKHYSSENSNNSGPGALSVKTIFERFGFQHLDESGCRALILEILHGSTVSCPSCGVVLGQKTKARLWEGKRAFCAACSARFGPLTGTRYNYLKMEFRQIVCLGLGVRLGMSIAEIAAAVGVERHTITRFLRQMGV